MLFTRRAKRILTFLFVVIVWVPLVVMLVTPQKKISELENRRLADAPQFNAEKPYEFVPRFEAYFNDHFGFRERLIHLFRLLEVKVFRVSRAANVIFGRDGWLFQAGEEPVADMRNNLPISKALLREWAVGLSKKHDALKEKGVDYLFLFVPNKHLIYPEKLPAELNRVREVSRAEQLIRHLDQHTDVPILDLRPALFEAKKQLRPYHRTDTHWNSWGAYAGYRALVERLQEKYPDLTPVDMGPEDFVKEDAPGGDLARSLSMQDELREVEVNPKDWEPSCAEYLLLSEDASRDDRLNNEFGTKCEDGEVRILIFRDSYILAMVGYLSDTFEYIHYYPASPVPLEGMLDVVEQHDPDVVIEQRSTRWLRRPYG